MTIAPEEIVRIMSGQGLPWDDLMRMQTAGQDAVDAFIGILLGGRPGYSGFQVVRTSDTVATISPGRLFDADGKRYALVDDQVEDLFSALPVAAGYKVISFVASGTELDTETLTRVFKVSADLTTPGTPQATATRRRRVAVVQRVTGTLGPEPVAPVIPAGYVELGRVVLDQSGIVGDPDMVEETRVPTLAEHADRLTAATEVLDEYGTVLSTLRSDLAALALKAEGLASRSELSDITRELGDLRDRVETPAAAVHIDEDVFETDDGSDDEFSGYAARVASGLRFPRASSSAALTLFTPSDPAVRSHSNGLVLPAYTDTIVGVGPGWHGPATAPIRPRDYTVSSRPYRVLSHARVYWWYGADLNRGQAEALIREKGVVRVFDPAENENVDLDLRGRAWTLSPDNVASPHFYRISLSEPYSDISTELYSANGAGIAQTFLSSGLRWLTGIGVAIRAIDPSGPLSLLLCGITAAGTPDLDNVIASGSVAAADMVLSPAATWIPIGPVLLVPGRRYAAVLVTSALHELGCVPSSTNVSGTLFYAGDGVYWQADANRDLSLGLRYAQFSRSVTTVELNPATLSGGMRELELAMVAIERAPAAFTLMGRASGGTWRPLDRADGEVLATAPDVLQVQARWVGTASMHAGVMLAQSRLLAARALTALEHVSSIITLPSARTAFTVQVDLVGFDDDDHDVAVSLLSGASYATETAASATVIEDTAEPAVKRLTATFTLGSAADTVRVKIEGSTSDATTTFAARRRRLVAS